MTVSHEGQQRVEDERLSDAWFEFETEAYAGIEFGWTDEDCASARATLTAAILASVLPDPRVTTLVTAARDALESVGNSYIDRSKHLTAVVARSRLRDALRAFDDKPDEEVDGGE